MKWWKSSKTRTWHAVIGGKTFCGYIMKLHSAEESDTGINHVLAFGDDKVCTKCLMLSVEKGGSQ